MCVSNLEGPYSEPLQRGDLKIVMQKGRKTHSEPNLYMLLKSDEDKQVADFIFKQPRSRGGSKDGTRRRSRPHCGDTCLHRTICSNNCPADAIPHEYQVTEGVKRWITDVAKCYTVSRMREQYCHICVDVCPYVHKANGDPRKKSLYKLYMSKRKKAGYKTPAWFAEDEENILGLTQDKS